MSPDPANPLGMVSDPFVGDTFVLPKTECTPERRSFFKRMNEIQGFLYVTKISFDTCKRNYQETIIPRLPSKDNTPMKLEMNGGNYIIVPARKIIDLTTDGINILTRQTFVMFYGSFETYLYQLFEKSFLINGITEEILDKSRDILMLKKWDGKFCKMDDVFRVGYKASELTNWFRGFKLEFEGQKHEKPLEFLDELTQVRHRIVHASSILEKDRMIFIDMNLFHGLFGFFYLLTDYVDYIFSRKFGYERETINPGEA